MFIIQRSVALGRGTEEATRITRSPGFLSFGIGSTTRQPTETSKLPVEFQEGHEAGSFQDVSLFDQREESGEAFGDELNTISAQHTGASEREERSGIEANSDQPTRRKP